MSKLILLVADQEETDRGLECALKTSSAGCVIKSAGTRSEIAALARPSLIILDLMLSAEPASELLSWLRNEPIYRDVPVFVLGSQVVNRDIMEAYNVGANSCFLMELTREQFGPIAEGIATYVNMLPAPAC